MPAQRRKRDPTVGNVGYRNPCLLRERPLTVGRRLGDGRSGRGAGGSIRWLDNRNIDLALARPWEKLFGVRGARWAHADSTRWSGGIRKGVNQDPHQRVPGARRARRPRRRRRAQVSAAEALKAAAQVEKPTPSDEKSDPPQPDGPAEAPAAPKPADPSDDEPQAADLHGSVDDDDLFSDYFVELERGIAALQKAWLHAPAEARGYFLAWVASGWRPPQGR